MMVVLFWSVRQPQQKQNCRQEVEVSCCWKKCQNRITQAKNYTKFFSWGDHTRHLMKNFLCIKLFQKWQIVRGKRCVIIWTIAEYPNKYTTSENICFESLANLIKQIKKAKVQFSCFSLCTMNKIGSKLQHVLRLVVSIQN